MKKIGLYEAAGYFEKLVPGGAARRLLQQSWRMLQRTKLLKGVITGRPSAPYVQIGPVSVCNFSCFFCHTHSNRIPKGEFSDQRNEEYYSKLFRDRSGLVMPLPMFQALIEDLRKIGVREIDLSGIGEPLLHPDIVEMVRYAHDHGIHCNITTNGALLSEAMAENLLQAGLSSITISVNSLDPQTYKTTHGVSSDEILQKLFATIGFLSEQKKRRVGFRLNASFAVSRLNLQELEQAAVFFSRHGFNAVYYRPYIALQHAPELVLTDEEAAEASALLKRLTGSDQDFFAIWSQAHRTKSVALPCYVGYLFCFVNSNGDVFPCCGCKTVMGSLGQQRFAEIWTGERYTAFRKNATRFYRRGSTPVACDCAACPEPVMQKQRFGIIGGMAEKMADMKDLLH